METKLIVISILSIAILFIALELLFTYERVKVNEKLIEAYKAMRKSQSKHIEILEKKIELLELLAKH